MSTTAWIAALILVLGSAEIAVLAYCDHRWWHLSEQNAKARDAELAKQCRALRLESKP